MADYFLNILEREDNIVKTYDNVSPEETIKIMKKFLKCKNGCTCETCVYINNIPGKQKVEVKQC